MSNTQEGENSFVTVDNTDAHSRKSVGLDTARENLTAAESRIRDLDIASEMAGFTQSQILSQANVAMLSQANALPQLALQLLG
ncbi:flagellin [Limisalsivibrio acetivorans]|uniref:flagellin n=1 Tax=Limisalsivibrio acetivorans TaxID=1304888 RepID=UPI0009DBEC5C|nr:flagellin [Limisalsivibrio acetivorans]